MNKVFDQVNALLAPVQDILTGEPARAIGYGAAAIIYVVAKLVGAIPDQTPDQALASATAGIAVVVSVVESIRHYVYSPNTVQQLTPQGMSAGATPDANAGQ